MTFFVSDIGITDVDVGCRISPTLKSMLMPTYDHYRVQGSNKTIFYLFPQHIAHNPKPDSSVRCQGSIHGSLGRICIRHKVPVCFGPGCIYKIIEVFYAGPGRIYDAVWPRSSSVARICVLRHAVFFLPAEEKHTSFIAQEKHMDYITLVWKLYLLTQVVLVAQTRISVCSSPMLQHLRATVDLATGCGKTHPGKLSPPCYYAIEPTS